MVKKLLILLCLTPALMLVSCSDDDDKPVSPSTPTTGSGNLVSETRTLPTFHSVTLTAVGSIRVSRGTTQSVGIEVDDNIMDYILTSVVNGVLIISSDPSVSLSDYDLSVTLTMTDLESLTLAGVGSIISEGAPLEADSIYLYLTGVGDISIHCEASYISSTFTGVGNLILMGSVDYQRIVHSAVGTISAYECSSDTTVAVLTGIGNVQVFVNDYLNVIIGGRGSLYYMGTPQITSVITGSGQVIDANPSN
ncbi:MAG: DUF2807 domain-containing protein [Candidatus Zixiibacteriota bacterium]|nr:MAG: DUF2807 domain-containing protein [candidate division Zixibacteria bacterium]